MTIRFEKDLRENCSSAAEFLREKDKRYNEIKKREGRHRIYSSEVQFVAEVYRL
jgi:hypothetical protein